MWIQWIHLWLRLNVGLTGPGTIHLGPSTEGLFPPPPMVVGVPPLPVVVDGTLVCCQWQEIALFRTDPLAFSLSLLSLASLIY